MSKNKTQAADPIMISYPDFVANLDKYIDQANAGSVFLIGSGSNLSMARLGPESDQPRDEDQVTISTENWMNMIYEKEHIKFLKIILRAMIEFGKEAGITGDKAYEMIMDAYEKRDQEELVKSFPDSLESCEGVPAEQAFEEIREHIEACRPEVWARRRNPEPQTDIPAKAVYHTPILEVLDDLRHELGIQAKTS